MSRRYIGMVMTFWLLTAPMAFAQSYADQIVQQLSAQGFSDITVEITLLGRIRIKGHNGQGLREIIMNPHTGEILRDMWIDANGNAILPLLAAPGRGEDSGSGSDDAEDDADEAADDAGDDADDAADDAEDDADDAADDAEDDADEAADDAEDDADEAADDAEDDADEAADDAEDDSDEDRDDKDDEDRDRDDDRDEDDGDWGEDRSGNGKTRGDKG
jgi:hypothetical protein